jgi:hypothetical protein
LAAGDLDADGAAERDEQPAGRGDHPPPGVEVEPAVQQRRRGDPGDAVQPQLEGVVGDDGDPGGGDAGGPAEAAGHVCVEGARVRRAVGHGGVAGAEEQQAGGDGDEGERDEGTATAGVGGGHDGDQGGERRGRGEREESDGGRADAAGGEGPWKICVGTHRSIEPDGLGI